MTFDDFIRDLHFARETLSIQDRHYQAVRVAEAIDLLQKYRRALLKYAEVTDYVNDMMEEDSK